MFCSMQLITTIFLLTELRLYGIIYTQSESVTLSVDYLISSTQADRNLLGFFLHFISTLKTEIL